MSDLHVRARPFARLLLTACTAGAALSLGACGSGGSRPVAISERAAPQPEESWASIKGAIALLNQGKSVEARERLIQLLVRQPGDTIARRLIDQIDQDPKLLLGAKSFSYTVKTGDTYSSLAEHFLGDPLLFYALARYNGVTTPADPAAGSTLMIPGKRAPAPRKEAAKAPEPKKPVTAAAKPAAPEPKPVLRAADSGRATKLRGMALAAMNSGAIDRAVALLRQALDADPSNATIKNDLGRALRVQSTVRRR